MPKMEAREAVEVYVGDHGDIIIKQSDTMGDEPRVIYLHADQVPTVVRWLQEAVPDSTAARAQYEAEMERWNPKDMSELARHTLKAMDVLYSRPLEVALVGRAKFANHGGEEVVNEIELALRDCGVELGA